MDFLDAYPVPEGSAKGWFERDIINVHYQPYYDDPKKPPADYYNPVPNYFLTVKPKVRFGFVLASTDEDLADKAADWLKNALAEFGRGGENIGRLRRNGNSRGGLPVSTMVTLVGRQPSAVAVNVATLLEHAGLKQVVLLPTQETYNQQTRRLMQFFKGSAPELSVRVLGPIATSHLDNPSGLPLSWELIQKWLDEHPDEEIVFFDATPGFNFEVALISYHLQGNPRLIPLYADHRRLFELEGNRKWLLENIGFKELLALYGLRPDKMPGESGLVSEVTITGGIRPFHLNLAREYSGRLRGLVTIIREFTDDMDENHRIKQEVRRIESLSKAPGQLNHLLPVFRVVTNDFKVMNRARSFGITVESIGANEDINNKALELIRNWESTHDRAPHWFKPGQGEIPLDFKNGPVELENPAGDWTGPNLLVSLGSDPSATLLSIFTHQPREAIILVDTSTTWVRTMAWRIRNGSTISRQKRLLSGR